MESLEELKLPAMKPIKVAVAEKVVGLEDEPLSPMALMFHKPDSNVCIITILGSKCRVDPEHLKSNLVQFVLSHPRLYSLQVVDAERGGMKWVVQTEVDLHKHVISQEINPTLLIATSPENYLENYLYNLSQTKIDMSKPLWEIHILNGLKTSIDTESVAIVRMHHSLGDGMSLMSLMLALARKTSDDKPLIMTKAEDDKNSITEKFLKKRSDSCIYKRLEGLRNGWRLIWNTFVDVLLFLATLFFLKDTKNPITAPADVGDTPKRIVHRTVSLDDIKLVARVTKTTVNDVVMGVTEAGLSRYLNRRYGELRSSDGEEQLDVSESISVVNLPRNMRMRAAVFFNIRVLAGFHVMGEMKEKGSLARWGNQIGYVVYPLKVGIRSNPVEYVLSAKAGMDRKKTSLESRFSYFFIKIMLKLFGIEAVKFSRNMSVYFSNMIGPREEISMFGYPIGYIATSCHGAPTGLLIHVVSYVDKLTFSVAVDESAVPDPHRLCDDLEESLNVIKQAVLLAQQEQVSDMINKKAN
ncbi:hypothetical protein QQ045_022149 [Rhodiola kirilowii]